MSGYYKDKSCARCGSSMIRAYCTTKYCTKCRKFLDEKQRKESYQRRRLHEKEREKNKPLPTGNSLHDVVARAKAAGRSYGQQVWFELWQKELMRRGKKIA